jgi:hypothetical protein
LIHRHAVLLRFRMAIIMMHRWPSAVDAHVYLI